MQMARDMEQKAHNKMGKKVKNSKKRSKGKRLITLDCCSEPILSAGDGRREGHTNEKL